MRYLVPLVLTCLFAGLGWAQDPQVVQILRKVDKARPSDKELSIYRLDWESSLKTAQKRALEEKRPLLVVAVRNEHGDTFTGYC